MAKINNFGTSPHTLQDYLLGMYAPAAAWPSGTTWYVHSSDGTNEAYSATGSERGLSPGTPFASLAYAIADPAVVASRNTHIVLLPGHTETVTGAAGVNLNKIGIRVIGEGFGRNRPTINYTTDAAASFDINSASCSVSNCVFTMTGVDAITAGINVKAANFTLEDCEIEFTDSTNQSVLALLTNASADRMTIRRCHFHGSNNAGSTAAIRIVGGTDIRILDSDIIGAFTTTVGCINVATTATVNLMVERCNLINLTAASTKVFTDTITASTGAGIDNRMHIASGTAPVTGATMAWIGNRFTAALGAADAAMTF